MKGIGVCLQGKAVTYQSCGALFGPFGYRYLTAFPTITHFNLEHALKQVLCFDFQVLVHKGRGQLIREFIQDQDAAMP